MPSHYGAQSSKVDNRVSNHFRPLPSDEAAIGNHIHLRTLAISAVLLEVIMTLEVVAAPINDTARSLGIGRTKVYELISEGKLQTIKIGRRTLVKADSIRALVAA